MSPGDYSPLKYILIAQNGLLYDLQHLGGKTTTNTSAPG
jgi:hypothetical protein